MSRWAVIAVESSVAWPTEETTVEFREHKLILRPATADVYASVAFQHPAQMSLDDALLLIRQFLSSLCWVEQAGIREKGAIAGSGPFTIGKGQLGGIVTSRFHHDYLPDPRDKRVRLALAFYREGMSVDSVATRVLNFFKILNILFSNGKQQVKWINDNLVNLRDYDALQRTKELSTSVSDIGEYLYGSGRCAVAHAYNEPLVDPENMRDLRRLQADLPLIQALAELVIEREMGLKSSHTVWREHLYHLDGFRGHLGEDITTRLKEGVPVQPSEVPAFGRLTVRVRDKPTLESLVGLKPNVMAVDDGVIWLQCDSAGGSLQLLLGLDVKNEYLLFDPQDHVAVSPEVTRDGLSAKRDHLLLLKSLLLNGQIEVIGTETGDRLGRTDAYVGSNIDMRATLANLDRMLAEVDRSLLQINENDA